MTLLICLHHLSKPLPTCRDLQKTLRKSQRYYPECWFDANESHGTQCKNHLKQIEENGCISNSYLLKYIAMGVTYSLKPNKQGPLFHCYVQITHIPQDKTSSIRTVSDAVCLVFLIIFVSQMDSSHSLQSSTTPK